jgi:hypothetical protein
MCCDDTVEEHSFTHVASRKPCFNVFDLIAVFPSATRFRISLLGELVQRGEDISQNKLLGEHFISKHDLECRVVAVSSLF